MDAVEFLKAKNRMCREYGDLPEDCFICPIGNDSGGCQAGALENWKVTEEILVQIVEKWAKEHPKKDAAVGVFKAVSGCAEKGRSS